MSANLLEGNVTVQSSDCFRKKVYNFLERPKTKVSIAYHLFLFVLILSSAVISIISTVDSYEHEILVLRIEFLLEVCLLVLFLVEFMTRLAVCSINVIYRGFKGRLRFLRSFFMLVDAFVITSTLATTIMKANAAYFTILRFTRFFQVLRILRLDRQRGDLRTMWKVVREHKKELVTCYFICFIIVFLGAFTMYYVEKTSKEKDGGIDNMVNGIYWSIVTFTSVGYGDYTPHSWPGKVLTSFFAIFGCAFFSLPAGIIGSGFALQVSKQKKEKKVCKIRHPAALLIQTTWRIFALRNGDLKASWYHVIPQLSIKEKPHEERERYNLIERKTSSFESKLRPVANLWHKKSLDNLAEINNTSFCCNAWSNWESSLKLEDIVHKSRLGKEELLHKSIRIKYKRAVLFILLLKLKTAVSAFKYARLPYVNVDGLLLKNNMSIAESLSNLKEINTKFDVMMKELHLLRQEIKRANVLAENKKDVFN